MTEIQCPYCEAEQEVNHDDGYGYDEDRYHTQECPECSREFRYTTAIHFTYSVFCNGDHVWESWEPLNPGAEGCSRCGVCRLIPPEQGPLP